MLISVLLSMEGEPNFRINEHGVSSNALLS